MGTPVLATKSGTVYSCVQKYGSDEKTTSDGTESWGNYIILKHKDGTYSLYAHLSQDSRTVSKGKEIKQGDIIAYSGDSGHSTGPHLHFSARTYFGSAWSNVDGLINVMPTEEFIGKYNMSYTRYKLPDGWPSTRMAYHTCDHKDDNGNWLYDNKGICSECTAEFPLVLDESTAGTYQVASGKTAILRKRPYKYYETEYSFTSGTFEVTGSVENHYPNLWYQVKYEGNDYYVYCENLKKTHTHVYVYENYDSAHPHKIYEYCSCGQSRDSGRTLTFDDCAACNPTNEYTSTDPDKYDYPERSLKYDSSSATMTGSDVAWVQAVLYQLGYSITIDGKYGPSTRNVVKDFQSDYGLEVDGSCGPATRAKLKELWEAKKHTTHSYTITGYDAAHPHKQYKKCSCGAVQYTGSDINSWKGMYYDTDHPHKEYRTCIQCGYVEYTGKTSTVSTCASCHTHSYSNACDASCNTCGATRTPAAHVYTNACDEYCNVCFALRSVPGHSYDNACDASCNICGATRTPAAHIYTNACDEYCNVCFALRSVPGHSYDNACDATCNTCGATRTITHSYTITGYDAAHPHKQYKKCSCGAVQYTGSDINSWKGMYYDTAHPHKEYRTCIQCGYVEYTGKTSTVSTCASCYPVGTASISLSATKVAVGEKVTVSWSAVSNAKEYNVKYRDSNQNSHLIATTSSVLKDISFDAAGTYVIYIDSIGKNGDYKKSNEITLTVYKPYVITYDLNGGTGNFSLTTSENTTIQLTKAVPQKEGYRFTGWVCEPNDAAIMTVGGTYYLVVGKSTDYKVIAQWECLTHAYDNNCDADCNVCGAKRSVSHTYDNDCDTDCNVCGQVREITHIYDNACDASCDTCGATRTPAAHVYDDDRDESCNVCGMVRVDARELIVMLSQSEVAHGDTFTVSVSLPEPITAKGFGLDFSAIYDKDAFEWVSGDWSQSIKENSLMAPVNPGTQSVFVAQNAFEISGEIFTLTLRVKETAACGSHRIEGPAITQIENVSPVGATVTVDHLYDNVRDFVCNICGYERPAYTPGDVDGIPGVSMDDAIHLLFAINFPDVYQVNQPCDFDGSGAVDQDDAIYLLFYVNFKDLYPLH